MNKNDIKRINTFIGLESIKTNDVKHIRPGDPAPIKNQDEMLSVIYAPDPVTGLPCSDVAMLMKHKDKPEIQQYLQQRLMVAHESISGADNPDDALKAIRGYKEDVRSYAERVRNEFKPAEIDAGESE